MSEDTYEIELEVEDESIPVTLEEPGPLTKTRIALEAPDIPDDKDEFMKMDPEAVDFMITLIEEVSDFPAEESLLDDLPAPEFNKLVEASSNVFMGNEPLSSSTEEFKFGGDSGSPFDDLDLNDDGSVDPDDWR